jgi:predicted deacylase
VSAWIGGGPGLRDYREEDMARVRQAVLNGLMHLGMLAGAPEREGAPQALRVHSVLKLAGRRGLVFMDKRLRGQAVAAGAELGYVKHPFSGDIVEVISAPRGGVVVDGGASWPIMPEDATLAILADPI